jgi:hypothetical protein
MKPRQAQTIEKMEKQKRMKQHREKRYGDKTTKIQDKLLNEVKDFLKTLAAQN